MDAAMTEAAAIVKMMTVNLIPAADAVRVTAPVTAENYAGMNALAMVIYLAAATATVLALAMIMEADAHATAKLADRGTDNR